MIRKYNLKLRAWEIGYYVGTRFYITAIVKE
jgi:hypothetical protein